MKTADTADILPTPIKFTVTEIAVDCVVFGYVKGHLKVLLVKNEKKGLCRWGIPSGFIKQHESADCTAERLLYECHITQNIFLRQLRAYCNSKRSPINRFITIAYYALINMDNYRINHEKMDCNVVQWMKIKDVPELIHDHNAIVDHSLMQLKTLAQQSPIALNLLPEKFTILELINLYQDILGIEAAKSNFRKKILNIKLLVPLNEETYDLSHRPARLYKFDSTVIESINLNEFSFDL